MSNKVEIPIHENDDQDQPEAPAPVEDSAMETPPDDSDVAAEIESEPDDTDKLEAAEQQSKEHYDRLLRLSAEFDNYKKRTTRETQELVKYANENLIKDLLTIVDNLERAIESAGHEGDADEPLMQGIQLTLSEVLKLLERYHVKPVKSLGEPFDPAFHQAMMQEETADQAANTVLREMQKGYILHDRLLRPAMVVVTKAPTVSPDNENEA